MVKPLSKDVLSAIHAQGRHFLTAATVPALLVLALTVRLYGIDWDHGTLIHPDERAMLKHVDLLSLPPASNLGVLADAENSPWNPRWFPYGSFPLYLLKGIQILVAPAWDPSVAELRFPGRALSATAGALTVLALYVLAHDLGGRRVALLAAALTALAVIHIQASHFYTAETFQTLFTVLSLWCLVRLLVCGDRRFSIGAGIFIALALATKISSAPLALPLVIAHLLYTPRNGDIHWSSRLRRLGLALGVGVLTLLVVQPYAFLDWGRFWADVAEERDMVLRIQDYPFTRQFIGTLPYLYPAKHLTLFGLGVPVGLLVWPGLFYALYRTATRREGGHLLVVAWVASYLLITGALPVKFLRYLLPAVPLLLLYASHMLVAALDWSRAHHPSLAPWVRATIAATVVATGLYALAYLQIYRSPHPAVRAATWIEGLNLSSDTVVLSEHWNEPLPGLERYEVHQLPMYDPDRPEKTVLLAELLAEAEVLTISSSRLYGTIPRLSQRYPVSSRFYYQLFQGTLGYTLVHIERAEPALPGVVFRSEAFDRAGLPTPQAPASVEDGGFALHLGYADESFRVIDHPTVLVFRNMERLSSVELARRITGF